MSVMDIICSISSWSLAMCSFSSDKEHRLKERRGEMKLCDTSFRHKISILC